MSIKKKTPPMRRSGPFSSLWAFVGRRWLLWAFLGLRWPSLAIVNCCGPSWACVGRRWLLWAFVGLRWPSLAAVGLCGPALAFVGRCWLLWAFLGLVVIKKLKMKCTLRKRPTYGPNDATGVVWALFRFVGLRWPSLAAVGLRGPALAFVGRCWLLWAFLGLVVIKKFKMQGTLRKRPTYGPNDASRVVWALFHLRGPSLAVVGCCGPSWACVGLLWLLCDSLSRFTPLSAEFVRWPGGGC